MAITSPYNFVPLNKFVYIPSWHDKVSQDIPFEDGEDGWIEVKWRNESPLFIRDASVSPDKAKCVYSMHIKQSDGERLYFIPGSSMKGMLRNIITILSYGKMTQYNNRFFGYREFDTKVPEGRRYQSAMLSAQTGWLEKKYDKQWKETFLLHPCIKQRKSIESQEISRICHEYDSKRTSWERNEAIQKQFGVYFPEIEDGYKLFCTGWMGNKKHEMLIPIETATPIILEEQIIRAFLTVYDSKISPNFDKYLNLLEKGERIPVSYVTADNGEIKAIGLGRMFRYPYKYDVQTLVDKEQMPEQYADKHDLAETMFGWTDGKKSMKGRVQFSNAFATNVISDQELTEARGVLGQPKASFYPLYAKQETNSYKTYEDASAIAGRKLYRIHEGSTTTDLPQGNGNENTLTTLRPIPAGNTFTMRINLHNLRPIEIGALLWAITFNHTDKVWHNIGQAKSFGYGKISPVSVTLNGLKHSEEEYLKSFELEMLHFTLSHQEGMWCETPSVTTFINILSEHSSADVRMMELQEYAPYRRNTQFSRLQEGGKQIVSTLPRTDFFRMRNQELFDNAELLYKEKKLAEAKAAYMKLVEQMHLQGIDSSQEQKIIADVESHIALQKEQDARLREAEKQKQIEEKLSYGLAAVLDEKYEQGPNAGEFKVREWKVCKQKVGKWLKDKKTASLDESEQDALMATVKRLSANPPKKENKEWKDKESKLWKEITDLLGEQRSKELFKPL